MTSGTAHEIQGSSLVIRPNRSLPVGGIVVLFAALSAWSVLLGAGFAFVGAGPMLPFAGVQFVVAGLLCRWLYRHLDDCELVVVGAERVRVMKRRGRVVTRHDFPRYWLRVRLDGGPGSRGPASLRVGAHGRFITLADEVCDGDRALVARELRRLLLQAPDAPAPGGNSRERAA